MGSGAVVAILIKKERDLVAHFRGAGATSIATAKTPDELGVHTRMAWERLVERAVIRDAGSGAYYLDEPTWEALRRMRRRMALVVGIVVVAAAILFPLMSARK